MEVREINDDYREIAEELIATEPDLAYIKESRVRIAFLKSDAAKKAGSDRLVHGECEKVQNKNQWAINYDFTITLFYPNNIGMGPDQLRVLLFHELLHIGIEQGPEGDEYYSIRKHDLEDFKTIVDRFGVNWADRPQDRDDVKEI